MYHDRNGFFFERLEDGSVRILQTDGRSPYDGGIITFEHTIPDGPWCSAVLSMSVFGERPGDWYTLMDHHHGRKDLLKDSY